MVSILTRLAPQKLDSDGVDALVALVSDEPFVAPGPLHETGVAHVA
jgi:hypothetical protein